MIEKLLKKMTIKYFFIIPFIDIDNTIKSVIKNTIQYLWYFYHHIIHCREYSFEVKKKILSLLYETITRDIHQSIVSYRLQNIIDATGAASYHGFLPVLVRTCIQHMTNTDLSPFPQLFATALFSFLYHLASYECGKWHRSSFSSAPVTNLFSLIINCKKNFFLRM